MCIARKTKSLRHLYQTLRLTRGAGSPRLDNTVVKYVSADAKGYDWWSTWSAHTRIWAQVLILLRILRWLCAYQWYAPPSPPGVGGGMGGDLFKLTSTLPYLWGILGCTFAPPPPTSPPWGVDGGLPKPYMHAIFHIPAGGRVKKLNKYYECEYDYFTCII